MVDDDPEALRYVRDVVAKAGYKPAVCSDPQQALRLVYEEKPDLVLLDLMLPGRDGIELMMDIKEETDVAVIFLSAYGQEDLIAKALDMGAVDYVVKPFSPTELLARIRAALRRQATPEPLEPYSLGGLGCRLRGPQGDHCWPYGRVDGNRIPDARRALGKRRAGIDL